MLTEVITAEARAKHLTETIDTAIDQLVAELAQGHTRDYLRLLSFWSRFHRYSHGNVLLIMSQRPDATQVAGYHTWRRLGRQVGKGAKAVIIWCPIIRCLTDPQTGLPVDYCAGFSPCPVFAAQDWSISRPTRCRHSGNRYQTIPTRSFATSKPRWWKRGTRWSSNACHQGARGVPAPMA